MARSMIFGKSAEAHEFVCFLGLTNNRYDQDGAYRKKKIHDGGPITWLVIEKDGDMLFLRGSLTALGRESLRPGFEPGLWYLEIGVVMGKASYNRQDIPVLDDHDWWC